MARENNAERKTALLSLFLLLVIFFAFAKSDIIAVAIVILKPCGFSNILFAYNLRSKYHSVQAEYHCEAIELATGE